MAMRCGIPSCIMPNGALSMLNHIQVATVAAVFVLQQIQHRK